MIMNKVSMVREYDSLILNDFGKIIKKNWKLLRAANILFLDANLDELRLEITHDMLPK